MSSYSIRLKGLKTPNGTISSKVLIKLMHDLEQSAQRSLRLLLDGASVKHGPIPGWLDDSTDFLIKGIGKGSTILRLDAPHLGETAKGLLQQTDMWREVPSPNDTSLSVLSLCIHDATEKSLDSERLDRGVLDSLSGLKWFLDYADSVEIIPRAGKHQPVILTANSVEAFRSMRRRTPEPRAMVVSGILEEIGHRTGQFKLELSDGNALRGRAHPEFMESEELRGLWGKKVLAKGTVHFKPSGAARFLDAELIKLLERGDEVFDRMPVAIQLEAEFAGIEKATQSRVDIAEIWNKWPGEESIEELLSEL